MKAPRPSLVLFDFGGVVAEFRPARRLTELARVAGLPEAEVEHRVWRSGLSDACDAGQYSAEGMHRELCAVLGVDLPAAELRRLMCLPFRLVLPVVEIARSVREQVRVGLLTNNSPLLWEALPEFFPELEQVFEPILFSFQIGALKPERELFDRVEQRLGLASAQILLVDDSAANVEEARSAGWEAIQFISPAALEGTFRSLGLISRSC